MIRLTLLTTTLLALAGPALAQPKTDPDWPCVQRKVASLSPGQFWTGPDLGSASTEWGNDNEAAALAQKVASRRTDLQEVDGLLDAYVAKLADKAAREQGLTRVYAGVFEVINGERNKVMRRSM